MSSLEFLLILATAVLGILSAATETKNKFTKKLTKWGIATIVLISITGMVSLILTYSKSKKEADNTKQLFGKLDTTLFDQNIIQRRTDSTLVTIKKSLSKEEYIISTDSQINKKVASDLQKEDAVFKQIAIFQNRFSNPLDTTSLKFRMNYYLNYDDPKFKELQKSIRANSPILSNVYDSSLPAAKEFINLKNFLFNSIAELHLEFVNGNRFVEYNVHFEIPNDTNFWRNSEYHVTVDNSEDYLRIPVLGYATPGHRSSFFSVEDFDRATVYIRYYSFIFATFKNTFSNYTIYVGGFELDLDQNAVYLSFNHLKFSKDSSNDPDEPPLKHKAIVEIHHRIPDVGDFEGPYHINRFVSIIKL
jgi:hypothetical protein